MTCVGGRSRFTQIMSRRCRMVASDSWWRPYRLSEHCLPAARGQGWVVLGSDSELLSEPIPARTMNMKLLGDGQSNPRRYED